MEVTRQHPALTSHHSSTIATRLTWVTARQKLGYACSKGYWVQLAYSHFAMAEIYVNLQNNTTAFDPRVLRVTQHVTGRKGPDWVCWGFAFSGFMKTQRRIVAQTLISHKERKHTLLLAINVLLKKGGYAACALRVFSQDRVVVVWLNDKNLNFVLCSSIKHDSRHSCSLFLSFVFVSPFLCLFIFMYRLRYQWTIMMVLFTGNKYTTCQHCK